MPVLLLLLLQPFRVVQLPLIGSTQDSALITEHGLRYGDKEYIELKPLRPLQSLVATEAIINSEVWARWCRNSLR